MQDAVSRLLAVTPKLTDDLSDDALRDATALLDQLVHPLSEDDIWALLSILPKSGDTAHGLNWTILHAIEAAPGWPIWAALTDDDNEWTSAFMVRLKNGGYVQP